MREYKITTGGRRWHGDELVKLQEEPLNIMQDFFKQAGACVIDGCAITGSTGNYTIAPGLVGISHITDGFKVAKFAGISGVALPGWLEITKTVGNKTYDDTNSKVAYHEFTATFSATQPVSNPFLKIEVAGGRKWQDAFRGDWTPHVATIGGVANISCNLKYKKNSLTNQLYIRGSVTAGAAQNLTNPATGVTVLNLPVGFRPAETLWFTTQLTTGVGGVWFKDSAGIGYIKNSDGLITPGGGLAVNMVKPEPTVSSYFVLLDLIIALD